MKVCADELEEEALACRQSTRMWRCGITNIGERDGSVGCIGAGGEGRRYKVQLEVVQMCHCNARRGSGCDAPAVKLLKRGKFS